MEERRKLERNRLVRQLQGCDPSDDQNDTQVSQERCWIAVSNYTHEERACRPDTSPHCVGSAKRDLLLGIPKQRPAKHHEEHGKRNSGDPGRRLLRHFQPHRPANLKQAGKNEQYPSQSRPPSNNRSGEVALFDGRTELSSPGTWAR